MGKRSAENNISIIGFWGDDLDFRKLDAFNLNQKIYKRFYKFNDLQFLMVVLNGNQTKVVEIIEELRRVPQKICQNGNLFWEMKLKLRNYFQVLGVT